MSRSKEYAIDAELNDWARGTFYCHSCVSTLNLSYETVQDWTRILQPLEDRLTGKKAHIISSSGGFTHAELDAFLLVFHERLHYLQLVTTPLGLLQYRVLNCLVSQLSFLLLVFERHFTNPKPATPILQWYRSVEALQPRVTSRLAHPDPPRFIDEQVSTAETLVTFWTALMGNARLSMRDFVDLANRAYERLGRISGCEVRAKWSARDLDRSDYLPDHGLTTTELLEGQARLLEYESLTAANVSKDALKKWKDKSLFGPYERGFRWILDKTKHPIASMCAIDVAICSPIDVVSSVSGCEYIMVEDVLPSWRICPAITAILSSTWPYDWDDITFETNEAIARRANIPTPKHAIETLLASTLSNWAGPRRLHSLVIANDYIEAQILQGMSKRLDSLMAIRTSNMFPVLEFYSDRLVINAAHNEEGAIAAYHTMYHLVFMLAQLSLLTDADVSLVTRLQRIVNDEFESLYGKSIFDFRHSVENNWPEPFSGLLRW